MTLELSPLPPLEERLISHDAHMMDIDRKVGGNTQHHLLRWEGREFAVAIGKGSGVIISPPFHDTNPTYLRPLAEEILKEYPGFVQFWGYTEPWKFEESPNEQRTAAEITQMQWYQTPLAVTEYAKKLKKFKNSEFVLVELGPNDHSDVVDLCAEWRNEKKLRLVERLVEVTTRKDSNPKASRTALNELSAFRGDVDLSEYHTFQHQLAHPKIHFYGARKEGELVAYTVTQGDNCFQKWVKRACIRMNPSPQEFVDLHVAKMLVEKGVTRFSRGDNKIQADL